MIKLPKASAPKLTTYLIVILFSFLNTTEHWAQEPNPLKPTKVNNKWGYADSSGKLVVPAQFDIALDFKNGFARVGVVDSENRSYNRRSSYKWGFVDSSGRLVVPLTYAQLDDFSEGLARVQVREARSVCGASKFGYVDTSGTMVIEPRFAVAFAFQDGRARVGVGLIDHIGRCLCCNPTFRGDYGYVYPNGTFVPDPKPLN